jgi:hypothetical protein
MNINFNLFFMSILIGISIIYILNPQPEMLLKYPNDKNIYIDNNNVCYKYKKNYL